MKFSQISTVSNHLNIDLNSVEEKTFDPTFDALTCHKATFLLLITVTIIMFYLWNEYEMSWFVVLISNNLLFFINRFPIHFDNEGNFLSYKYFVFNYKIMKYWIFYYWWVLNINWSTNVKSMDWELFFILTFVFDC